MKRCPACQRVYSDETIKFCRVDGTTLVNGSAGLGESKATRVLPYSHATDEAPTEMLRETGEGKLSTSALKGVSISPGMGARRRTLSRRNLALFIIAIVLIVVVVPFAILGIAGYVRYRHARDTEVAIESIAVLPFENQIHDPDSEYLSDGVTESIINNLARLPNLRVIARNTAFTFKGRQVSPQQIGDQLQVRAILT